MALSVAVSDDSDIMFFLDHLVHTKNLARSSRIFRIELARNCPHTPSTRSWLKDLARCDKDAEARLMALWQLAFGWENGPEVRDMLVELVRVDQINPELALRLLIRDWSKDPELSGLLKQWARSHPNDKIRSESILALVRGWPHDPDGLMLLKERAGNDGCDEQLAALDELERGWANDPEAKLLLAKYAEIRSRFASRVIVTARISRKL